MTTWPLARTRFVAVGVGKWSEIPGQFPLDEIEIAKNMVSKEDAECEVFFLMNSMDHAQCPPTYQNATSQGKDVSPVAR